MSGSKNTSPNVWTQYRDSTGWHSQLYYMGQALPVWIHRLDKPGARPRWYVTQEPTGDPDHALVDHNGRFMFNDLFKARNLARTFARHTYV